HRPPDRHRARRPHHDGAAPGGRDGVHHPFPAAPAAGRCRRGLKHGPRRSCRRSPSRRRPPCSPRRACPPRRRACRSPAGRRPPRSRSCCALPRRVAGCSWRAPSTLSQVVRGRSWWRPAGALAELEAALARALLLAGGGVIEAAHLDLGAEPPAVVAAAAAAAPGGAALEYLLAELAHELRNPLVTIKTFADHLPALLEDAELRTRFASLTGDAIERMDGLLENVLAFARLGAP